MELVVIVLNKTQYLTEILNNFMEADIKGATVIDSSGMGHIMADHFPIFSMFADINDDEETHSKTIFTVVKSAEEREKILKELENVVGDISTPNTAILFSVPVNFIKGILLNTEGDK